MPKISQLPATTALTNADLFAIVQAGITEKATASQVLSFVSANITIPPSAISGAIGVGQGGTGISSPTAHTLPVAEGTANFNFLGPLTNGQILIGFTGQDPLPANLLAGDNISIANTGGSITISSTGLAGFSWTVVTTTTHQMASNNGYINESSTLTTYTLPATSVVGDEIDILGSGTGGWKIAQMASQQIVLGNKSSTVGTGGSVASTLPSDSGYMICKVANSIWQFASAPQGNLTLV